MNIAAITDHAKEFLLKHGKHPPVVFVEMEGDESPYILPFANFPFNRTEEREQALFQAARHFALKMRRQLKGKKVMALAFAIEAWGRKQKPGTPYIRPTNAPDRVEILAVTMLDVASMETTASIYEMVRAGGSLDLVTLGEPDKAKSSLLSAFLTGIQTASQEIGMARARLRRVCEEYGMRGGDQS